MFEFSDASLWTFIIVGFVLIIGIIFMQQGKKSGGDDKRE